MKRFLDYHKNEINSFERLRLYEILEKRKKQPTTEQNEIIDILLKSIPFRHTKILIGSAGVGKSFIVDTFISKVKELKGEKFVIVKYDILKLPMAHDSSSIDIFHQSLLRTIIPNINLTDINVNEDIMAYIHHDFLRKHDFESNPASFFKFLQENEPRIALNLIFELLEKSNRKFLLIIDNFDVLSEKMQNSLWHSIRQFLSYSINFLITMRNIPPSISYSGYTNFFEYILVKPPNISTLINEIMLISNTQLKQYSELFFEFLNMRLGSFNILGAISSNNIRKSYYLVEKVYNYLSFTQDYELIINQSEYNKKQYFIKALVQGGNPYYDSIDKTFLNIFNPINSDNPFSRLVGLLLLNILEKDKIQDSQIIEDFLLALGFNSYEVIELIQIFQKHNLVELDQKNKVIIPTKTSKFYKLIIREPSYLFLSAQDINFDNEFYDFNEDSFNFNRAHINKCIKQLFSQLNYDYRKYNHAYKTYKEEASYKKMKLIPSSLSLRSYHIDVNTKLKTEDEDTSAEIYIDISDSKVSPLVVGNILNSISILAVPYERTLKVDYAMAGSFKATILASYKALTKIVSMIKLIFPIIKKHMLIDEHRNKLNADAEIIYAKARAIDAKAKKNDIDAFIKLIKAVGDVDKAKLIFTKELELRKEKNKNPKLLE